MAEKKQNIYEKLSAIQQEIAVPKGERNNFAKFNYRTVDKILVVATPLAEKNRTTLYTTDNLIQLGNRYYIESTARLVDWDSDQVIECKALAREQEIKKGMDEAQVTGTSSTYARKRALESLLSLNTEKDPDSMDNSQDGVKKPQNQQPVQQPNNIDITELTTTYQSLLMKAEKDGIDTHSDKFINYMKKNAQIDSTDVGNLIVDPNALQRAIETLQTMPTPGGNK